MGSVLPNIEKLERLRDRIQAPAPFYERMKEPWTQLARRVVEQTLNALQPADIEAALWQEKIKEIADRVSSEFLSGDEEVGIAFTLAPRRTIEPELADEPANFSIGKLTIADVERWVREGREKDSPDAAGKNLDERDAGKSDLQIAWRIMYALKLQKPGWERLLKVLGEFIGFEARDAAELLYPELLKAWVEVFSVRAPFDWQRYVHGLVSE